MKKEFSLSPELQTQLIISVMRSEVYSTTDWNVMEAIFDYGFQNNVLSGDWFSDIFDGCSWMGSWYQSSMEVWEKGWKFWTTDHVKMYAWKVVKYCIDYDHSGLVHIMYRGSANIQQVIRELSSDKEIADKLSL